MTRCGFMGCRRIILVAILVMLARLTFAIPPIAIPAAAFTAFVQTLAVVACGRCVVVLRGRICCALSLIGHWLQAFFVDGVISCYGAAFTTATPATAAFTTRWACSFLTVGIHGFRCGRIGVANLIGARFVATFGAPFGSVATFATALGAAITATTFAAFGTAFCVAAFNAFTTLGTAFGVSAFGTLGAFAAAFASFCALTATAFTTTLTTTATTATIATAFASATFTAFAGFAGSATSCGCGGRRSSGFAAEQAFEPAKETFFCGCHGGFTARCRGRALGTGCTNFSRWCWQIGQHAFDDGRLLVGGFL
jgi:hypothetical protein